MLQEVQTDGRIVELIREARRAGAYRACVAKGWGRPDGFGLLADKHSARVAALADEIAKGALDLGSFGAPSAMPPDWS